MKLRPYQEKVYPKFRREILKDSSTRCLVATPTGSGKTHMIGDVAQKVLDEWPKTHILILSHNKEILKQNYEKLQVYLPNHNVGIFSAGLGRREAEQITIAGIQSAYNKPELFGKHKLIIVDECHLISPNDNSMYQQFFSKLGKHTLLGFTATPYRLDGGWIHKGDNRTFDKLIYDLTSLQSFNRLVKEGYLCSLVSKATNVTFDTEGIKTTAGDFNLKELDLAFNRLEITKKAIAELKKLAYNRSKILVFGINIDHCDQIAEILNLKGIEAGTVHSKQHKLLNDGIIEEFKTGQLRALVSADMLAVGFDDPSIDCIALLRPTKSPVFHVQSIGRGLRISEGKIDCLVLDFASNVRRLGPINNIRIIEKGKGRKGGDPITKTCPECNTIVFPAVRICPECNYEFQFKHGIEANASTCDVIIENMEKWYDVDDIFYRLHQKANSPDSLLVEYSCGLLSFKEWICLNHTGYAKHKADQWIKQRINKELRNVKEALENAEYLFKPIRILVDKSQKYPIIIDYKFNGE